MVAKRFYYAPRVETLNMYGKTSLGMFYIQSFNDVLCKTIKWQVTSLAVPEKAPSVSFLVIANHWTNYTGLLHGNTFSQHHQQLSEPAEEIKLLLDQLL